MLSVSNFKKKKQLWNSIFLKDKIISKLKQDWFVLFYTWIAFAQVHKVLDPTVGDYNA